MSNEMSEEMKRFIGLSAVLTGFSKSILAPGIDPVDIKSDYLPFFRKKLAEEFKDSDLFDTLLSTFSDLSAKGLTDTQIGQQLLNNDNGDFVTACRKLIFMWYSGAWPTIISARDGQPESTVSTLISAKSYTQGLVWQVMQSHPMGSSNYRYGYWAKVPPELSAYTGHDNQTQGAKQ
ncbi:hypothetical protein [Marinimicrobium locisalis]|uniref:hypothetical protein n=1 Tax=Marinimicrobium locisalis TaxID=546022 RepID=UPI0032219084